MSSTRRSRISIEHGLGTEPNNLLAINSLKGYRAMRWGRNVELIVTDQRSYRSEEPLDRAEAEPFSSDDFPEMVPEEAMVILDAGRAYDHGRPPATIRYGSTDVANFRKDDPPQTILGEEQKRWFLEQTACLEGHMEDLGQHHGDARYARRSAEPSRRADAPMAGRRIRRLRWRRSQQRVCRTRRNLRLRS